MRMKMLRCVGIIALAAAIGLGMTGCPTDSEGSNPFVGTWTGVDSDGDRVQLVVSDTTWIISWPENSDYGSFSGTYTYTNNSATLFSTSGHGTAIVSGNTLNFNLTDGGDWLSGTLTKSGGNNPNNGGGGNVSLTITNNTGYTAWYLYVSLSTASSWGADRLGSSVLSSGTSTTVQVSPGIYDVRLTDTDGDTYTKRNISVTSNSTVVFLISDIDW